MASLADALASSLPIPPVKSSELGAGAPDDKQKPDADQTSMAITKKGLKELEPLETKLKDDEKKIPVLPTEENGMLKAAPKPDTSNDPMKGYVSSIGILGAIGSMFTRRPMTNSMNAAAGVLESMKQQDAADFKQKFDTWKIENENALKLFDYQRDMYKDIMSNDRLDVKDKMAKTEALASAFKDDYTKEHMRNGDWEAHLRAQADMERAANETRKTSAELEQFGREKVAFDAKKELLDADLKAGAITKEQYAQGLQEAANPELAKARITAENAEKKSAQKLGPVVRNKLANYPDLTPQDLEGIDTTEKKRLTGAFESLDNIEHIAKYMTEHPDAIGLAAEAAKNVNLDAIKGLEDNEAQAAVDAQVNQNIDSLAGGSTDMAASAKVLGKLLTTQSFTDASAFGSRGATIYLDKAFQKIYQQASRPDTLINILSERAKNSQDVLKEYGMGLENAKNKADYPLAMGGAEAFNKQHFDSYSKTYTPDEARKIAKDPAMKGKVIRIKDDDGVHEIRVH